MYAYIQTTRGEGKIFVVRRSLGHDLAKYLIKSVDFYLGYNLDNFIHKTREVLVNNTEIPMIFVIYK